MNILWPIISVYFLPVFCAYLVSGIFYIVCDISKAKADRPGYLANPISVTMVGVLWPAFIIQSMWRNWQFRSRYTFFDHLKKKVVPQIAVFLVLVLDFIYIFRYMV
jgi:hypothetical protein